MLWMFFLNTIRKPETFMVYHCGEWIPRAWFKEYIGDVPA